MESRARWLVGAVLVTLGGVVWGGAWPAAATAQNPNSDQWLPRSDGAEWTYEWSNSRYATTPRRQVYKVQARSGSLFRLTWEGVGLDPDGPEDNGTLDFRHIDSGLVNLDYSSTAPPTEFPILCAGAAGCGNSVAGAFYQVIWGTRSPTLAEPLLRGTRWNSLGGAADDVASSNRYMGPRTIKVPAFPSGVATARVDSSVTQAGALGDPFGSGTRSVYWARGVGPVYVTFRHSGGEISAATLVRTNQRPLAAPSDANFLPLNRGDRATFRWRNSRHMRRWSRQRFEVSQVVNNTARVDVRQLAGPISVTGLYALATRLSGVTLVSSSTRARTRARFPRLRRGRRFLTPFDLMTYGFGPVISAFPVRGEIWGSSRDSVDFRTYGVTGRTRVLGTRRVRTRLGRLNALVLRSTLTQGRSRFGSGTRTIWFAPGRGLVKLVFRHRDGSVSTVERLRR